MFIRLCPYAYFHVNLHYMYISCTFLINTRNEMRKTIIALMLCLISGQPVFTQTTGTFTDPRDGKEYQTIIIGNKEWTAQNMNFRTRNSWCYGNNPDNCLKYGRLYTYQDALRACPPGWRLPFDEEWDALIKHIGIDVAALRLKTDGNSGFNVLMSGLRYDYGEFNHMGEYAYFWSNVGDADYAAWVYVVGRGLNKVYRIHSFTGTGFSVRCIKR